MLLQARCGQQRVPIRRIALAVECLSPESAQAEHVFGHPQCTDPRSGPDPAGKDRPGMLSGTPYSTALAAVLVDARIQRTSFAR